MAGVNKACILGNVGNAPEIKKLNDGTELANFSVATSETWRDKSSGEKREKTEWHRITVWGENMVNVIKNYVHKGDKIYLEGKIETRKYQKDGTDHYSTEIVVKGFGGVISLIGKTENRGSGSSASASSSGGSGRMRDAGDDDGYGGGAARPDSGRGSELDDEIPF